MAAMAGTNSEQQQSGWLLLFAAGAWALIAADNMYRDVHRGLLTSGNVAIHFVLMPLTALLTVFRYFQRRG